MPEQQCKILASFSSLEQHGGHNEMHSLIITSDLLRKRDEFLSLTLK